MTAIALADGSAWEQRYHERKEGGSVGTVVGRHLVWRQIELFRLNEGVTAFRRLKVVLWWFEVVVSDHLRSNMTTREWGSQQ